jgi:hypothetical protein
MESSETLEIGAGDGGCRGSGETALDEYLILDPLTAWEQCGVIGVILLFAIGLFRPLIGEIILWMHELGMVFCFIAAILAPSFLRARRKVLYAGMEKFSRNDDTFFALHREYLETHERGYKPFLVGLSASGFYLFFRAVITWDLIPYQFDGTQVVTAISGAIGFGVLVRAIWLFLAFAFLISQVSVELENKQARLFSWELLERAGRGYARTALGASLFSFMTFWLVVSSQSFMFYEGHLSAKIQFISLMLVMAVGFPLFYLMLPLWRLHRILLQRKGEIRELFRAGYHQTEKSFLEKPSKELAREYLLERQVRQEIENLPEWPFKLETFAQIITVVALPTSLFIFKEVIVDVLVELLKK